MKHYQRSFLLGLSLFGSSLLVAQEKPNEARGGTEKPAPTAEQQPPPANQLGPSAGKNKNECDEGNTCAAPKSDSLRVTEVWIKRPKVTPKSESLTAGKAGLKEEPEEVKKLRKDLEDAERKLKECKDARQCRNELATAQAVIRLKRQATNGSGPIELHLTRYDLMESNNVRFLDANPGLILNWNQINPNCKCDSSSGSSPNTENQPDNKPKDLPEAGTPSTPSGTQPAATSPAPSPPGGLIQNPSLPPNPNASLSGPAITARGLAEFAKAGGAIAASAERMSELLSAGDFDLSARPADRHDSSQRSPSKPYLSGTVEYFTFEQPSLPWELLYEIEGDKLRQWVRFGNLSAYDWPCDTHIHLIDEENPTLSVQFSLKQELKSEQSAIRILKELKIEKQHLEFQLTSAFVPATLVLTLANPAEFFEGDVRGNAFGTAYRSPFSQQSDGTVKLTEYPSFRANKGSKTTNHELVGRKYDQFLVGEKRTTTVALSDLVPSNRPTTTVLIKVPATEEWMLPEGSKWVKDESNYVLKTASVTSTLEPLIEVKTIKNPIQLDFYDVADRKKLTAMLKKESNKDTEIEAILRCVLGKIDSIVENQGKIDGLARKVSRLKGLYEPTDESRQSRLHAIYRELERERQAERASVPTLEAENARLRAEIDQILSQ